MRLAVALEFAHQRLQGRHPLRLAPLAILRLGKVAQTVLEFKSEHGNVFPVKVRLPPQVGSFGRRRRQLGIVVGRGGKGSDGRRRCRCCCRRRALVCLGQLGRQRPDPLLFDRVELAEAGRLDVRGSRIEGLGAQTALAVAHGGQARLEHVYVEGAQVKTAQVAGAAVFENTRLVGGEATLPGRPVAMEISGEAALSCVAVTAHEVGLSLDGGAAWVDQVWIEAATACEGAGCPPLGE